MNDRHLFKASDLSEAECVFCAKEKAGLTVEFRDGSFTGHLCWADLKKACTMKQRQKLADPPAEINI